MKQIFTIKKVLLLVLLTSFSNLSWAQTEANFFVSFSDATENAASKIGGATPTFTNGHLNYSTGAVRHDYEYGFSDGTDESLTLNPQEDVYFAVKFLGSAPSTIDLGSTSNLFQFYFDKLSDTPDNYGGIETGTTYSSGSLTVSTFTTSVGGNDVIYFNLNSGSNAVWDEWLSLGTDIDLTSHRIELKFFGSANFTLDLDWVGTFTTVADIQAMADAADDGVDDGDEVFGIDASLSDLILDGTTTIPGFSSSTYTYDIVLAEGTTTVPTISGTLSDGDAAITSTTQAGSVTGTAEILVTAGDGITTQLHVVNFSVYEQETDDALFISMSDVTQNGLHSVESGSYTIEDGVMNASGYDEGGTFRQDWEYGFKDGTDYTFTINPQRDVYFAVKFNGGLYAGFDFDNSPFDFYLDAKSTIVSSDHVVSTIEGEDEDLLNYTTLGGDVVVYFSLEGLGNSDWNALIAAETAGVSGGDFTSSYDVNVNRLEFKFRPVAVAFDWNIDWVGFFTTVPEIEAAADTEDDFIWNGSTDSDWATASNWEGAMVPSDIYNVIIPDVTTDPVISSDVEISVLSIKTGASLTVSSDRLTVNGESSIDGDLIIESSAELVSGTGDITDDVTINRTTRYSDGKYSFVGVPVKNGGGSIVGDDLGPYSYSYDETQAYADQGGLRWVDASSAALIPGEGYAQAGQQGLSFSGVPNDDDVVLSDRTDSFSGTPANDGWNMLSNPYPCAIDAASFFDENTGIDATIYLWDDGGSDNGGASNSDYLAVNRVNMDDLDITPEAGAHGGSFNGAIGSMQGFFVKVTNTSGIAAVMTDVTFSPSMRAGEDLNSDANFFRTTELTRISLAIDSKVEGFHNETVIGFASDATEGKDRIYDAYKMIGNENLQLYSIIGDSKFAIQGLPKEEGASTELGFNLGIADELTLSVSYMKALAEGMTFHLTDKLTGKTYDLSETQSIKVIASEGVDQNRFILTYTSSNTIMDITESSYQPLFRTLSDELIVDFGKSMNIEGYSVSDISGRKIIEQLNSTSADKLSIPVRNSGVNIIRIVTLEGIFTRKLMF